MGFEFGEGHLDGIEIGAVGRSEEEPRAPLLEDGGGFLAFVAGGCCQTNANRSPHDAVRTLRAGG
jgi:hypothetical protein